ncbi:GerAB/ArcD/ProY family transporter [Virgibacillus oceani]|uniref:Germination protein GerLB n=1 Tax=Virgibacillus oceani TaxID=1479511 RepID=A0A917HCZ1_9BACI|nr:endospore germination permease [Virgibacillus oceani]GGG73967.1 germination protein GerLB [Virgibacillus oceani]
MKWFEYGDEKISHREIMIAIPSMVIGVGILSLPRSIAGATTGSDGWISLLVIGVFFVLLTWIIAKIASSFPNQSFLSYTSLILTKPVAIVFTFLYTIVSIMIAAYEVREISNIAKQYLFDRTPVEVISLIFLLVVVYAVAGSRAGIFRLNMMFLPIIILVALAVFVFNLGWFRLGNLLPVFETSLSDYVKSFSTGITSYVGFGIILFYISLAEKPEKTPRFAVIGMGIPIVVYILLYITCLGVFGHSVTSNLLYPTIELAKEIDIPGGFFERVESVFFVIWIMAIFNTTVMALDIAILALSSIFKSKDKMRLILILSPLVYVVAMYPKDIEGIGVLGNIVGYSAIILTFTVTVLLGVVGKLRRVKQGD